MSPHAQDTVPTGTNNWWKEATVYQVCYSVIIAQIILTGEMLGLPSIIL